MRCGPGWAAGLPAELRPRPCLLAPRRALCSHWGPGWPPCSRHPTPASLPGTLCQALHLHPSMPPGLALSSQLCKHRPPGTPPVTSPCACTPPAEPPCLDWPAWLASPSALGPGGKVASGWSPAKPRGRPPEPFIDDARASVHPTAPRGWTALAGPARGGRGGLS